MQVYYLPKKEKVYNTEESESEGGCQTKNTVKERRKLRQKKFLSLLQSTSENWEGSAVDEVWIIE